MRPSDTRRRTKTMTMITCTTMNRSIVTWKSQRSTAMSTPVTLRKRSQMRCPVRTLVRCPCREPVTLVLLLRQAFVQVLRT